jgi:hypothetical protein
VQQQVVERWRPVLAKQRRDVAEAVRSDADRDPLVDPEAGMKAAGTHEHRDGRDCDERAGDAHSRHGVTAAGARRGALIGVNSS